MFFFKIAFTQIAQIHHQNYFVFLFQLYGLLVKCFQCLKLRVYRHITELHHFSRLRYGWHTDQPLFTRQISIISDIFNSGISQPFYPLIHQSLSNPFLAAKNFGYTSYFYMMFFSQIFHDSCILCNFIQIDMYAWIQLWPRSLLDDMSGPNSSAVLSTAVFYLFNATDFKWGRQIKTHYGA